MLNAVTLMIRPLRAAVLCLALALPAIPVLAEPLELTARAVPFDAADAARERAGKLVWRGGIEITSPNPRFGGLSGLLVSGDGTELTAVSDEGHWFTARLAYDEAGRLSGIEGRATGALHGPKGEHLTKKRRQDSESLARLPDGSVAVAFERKHRLWRYPPAADPLAGRPTPLPVPPELKSLRSNSGIEGLATLSAGALFALAEGRREEAESPAYLLRDGAWSSLRYRRHGTFRPTGAATLPGGDLLIVERRFNIIDGVAVRLRRIAAARIVPGALLEGEVIASLAPPLTVDNFEGVAARRAAGGETLVYLVSDDNFKPVQRTLLLMFALRD